jgi:L-alanine-DL-glutamate epimerase-like enolase superfamily enzyme
MGRPCIPHSWTNAVAHAANAHLVAAIPNRVMLETQQINNPMLTDLVDHPIPVHQGYVDLSERPGLGIELREDVVASKPFLGGRVSFPLVKAVG